MIFLNQFSLSDMFFPLATMATLATTTNGAASAVASSVFSLATTGNRLTLRGFKTILATLANMQGGKAKPENKGCQKPLSTVVFFCHSKIKAVSNRLNSVMAGLLGNSKELPFLCTVFCRLFQSCHLCTANHSGGLNPQYKGHTAMNTQTSSATTPQNHTQDLTQLNKAFLKLCSSIGIANNKAPENLTSGNFDMIATDADELLQIANALFSQKLTADRAFKQALFDAVPMENQQA